MDLCYASLSILLTTLSSMPLEYNSQSHFYTHKALFTVQKSVAFTGVTSLSQKDEGLSRPSWLAYNGQFTHKVVTCPTGGRAQDRKSPPVTDVLPTVPCCIVVVTSCCNYVVIGMQQSIRARRSPSHHIKYRASITLSTGRTSASSSERSLHSFSFLFSLPFSFCCAVVFVSSSSRCIACRYGIVGFNVPLDTL